MPGLGSPEARLSPSGDAVLWRFQRLLVAELQRGFFDKHVWLSMWDRPPRSRFTRVQRATCCVLLVGLFLGANAVWYGAVGDSAHRCVLRRPPACLGTPHHHRPSSQPMCPLPQPGPCVQPGPTEPGHRRCWPGVQPGRLPSLPGHPVPLPHVPEQGGCVGLLSMAGLSRGARRGQHLEHVKVRHEQAL